MFSLDDLKKRFEDRFPSCICFYGPVGVGKREAALEIARYLSFEDDIVKFSSFLKDDLVKLRSHLRSRSFGGNRVFILDLSKSSVSAVEGLLKVIEESPDWMFFVLVSEKRMPQTIESRSFVMYFSKLSKGEVKKKLVENGVNEGLANTAASLSDGDFKLAKFYVDNEGERRLFLTIMRSIATKNLVLFSRVIGRVDELTVNWGRYLLEDLRRYRTLKRTDCLKYFVFNEINEFLDRFSSEVKRVEEYFKDTKLSGISLLAFGLKFGEF